jgi:hypothetical protein
MVYNGTELNSRLNPLAQAVSVQMTVATTGSNGIQQLDNANLNMGTNNFTVHWEGSLQDYTPSPTTGLVRKYDSGATLGFAWQLPLSGVLRLIINSATYDSTVASGIADSSFAKITVVVTRETASVAGSVVFYVNGVQLGASVSITAASPATLSSTVPSYICGTSTARVGSDTQAARLFNRALTSAEVLSLCINGVALADRGASQTNRITGDSANFEGGTVGSWANNSVAPASLAVNTASPITGTNDLLCVSSGVSRSGFNLNIGTITAGAKYRITFKYIAESGATWSMSLRETTSGTSAVLSTTTLSGATALTSDSTLRSVFWEFQANETRSNNRLLIQNSATAVQSIQVDDFEYTVIGLTSELLASNAQSDTGQIFDTSGNKNHALLPASGATIVGAIAARRREVRWTNTWSATSELQYVGGVNQAIFPINQYIDSLIVIPEGATLTGFTIGNGSNASYYATVSGTITSGVAIYVQLDRRVTDGTNRKLTITPMGAFTGNINTTLVGTELERR